VGERGCCAGELNEGKRDKGRARMGRARAPGARGPSWAGPGWAGSGQAGLGRTAGQNPVAHTTTDRKSIREAKSETELSNAHD
jgi:hypothetical protein